MFRKNWYRVFTPQTAARMVSLPIIVLLLAYNLRRLLFALTILLLPKKPDRFRDRPPGERALFPDVLILVPCRNEESVIAGLCDSLIKLDYPATNYQVVLIDDGSQDNTRSLMKKYAENRPGWHVFALEERAGKANALNAALEKFLFGTIIFVYDADHRPQADAIRRAAAYFEQEQVAGVSGRTLPANALVSPSAYYAAVESYVHQMVTMRAKDRLGLAPALLGSNCGYRRRYLTAGGGFRKGALLEDSDLTLTFYRRGYLIRFAEDVIAYNQVPETVTSYLRQHRRWARGFNDVSQNHSASLWKNRNTALVLRLELFMFATGYLDRISLVGAGLMTGLSFLSKRLVQFPAWVLIFALLSPLFQIVTLFAEQRAAGAMWRRLPWVPVFFLLDIYAALQGLIDSVMNRPRIWQQTERAQREL